MWNMQTPGLIHNKNDIVKLNVSWNPILKKKV